MQYKTKYVVACPECGQFARFFFSAVQLDYGPTKFVCQQCGMGLSEETLEQAMRDLPGVATALCNERKIGYKHGFGDGVRASAGVTGLSAAQIQSLLEKRKYTGGEK